MRMKLVAILVLGIAVTGACSDSPPDLASGSIAGVVTVGGAGASDVQVMAIGPTVSATTPAADGSYTIGLLADGTYTVRAFASSTLEEQLDAQVTVASGGRATAATLDFTPAGRLAGRVRLDGAETGNAGVYVSAAGRTVFTDDAGQFELEVRTGTLSIRAEKIGFASATVADLAVARGELTTVPTIDLLPGDGLTNGTLAGTALRVDGSHAGTVVSAGPFDGTTGADGAFEILGVNDGFTDLTFDYAGYTETIPNVLFMVSSGPRYLLNGVFQPLPPIPLQIGRRVAPFETAVHGKPVLSPDGARVAYMDGYSSTTLRGRLMVAAADGSGAVVIHTAALAGTFSFSPDSQSLLYYRSSTIAGKVALVAVPVAGGAEAVLSLDATNGTHQFTPATGQGSVYFRSGTSVLEVTIGGALLNTYAGATEFRILPVTKRILLLGTSGLQVAACVGSYQTPSVLATGVSTINGTSPDENYVAFVQSTPSLALKVAPVAGGIAATIDTPAAGSTIGQVVFSLSTFNLFYTQNTCVMVCDEFDEECWDVCSSILYQRDRFASTARTSLGAVANGTALVLSTLDDKLAFMTSADALVVRTLATGAVATLATAPSSWLPSTSRDKILFGVTATSGHDIKSFNFADGAIQTFTNCPVSTFTPTPSGRLLCTGAFGATLSDAAAGGTPTQLVASPVANAQLSPDGTHLLLRTTGTDPSSYRTRISDGATTRLVSGAGEAVIGAGNRVATYKSTAATGFDFQKGIYVSTAP